MFYHDRRISNIWYKRNVCVDILNYNSDGTIQKVIVTADGPSQIKKFNPYSTIQAETIWKQKGIETNFINGDHGDVMLTNISNGDYTSLKGVDFGSGGAKTFEVHAASASGGGAVEVHLDKPDGSLVATCKVSGTGGWKNWKTFSCDVSSCTGVKNVYFVYKGSNEPYRLDWFRFAPKNTTGVNKNKSVVRSVQVQKGIEKICYPLTGKHNFQISGCKIYDLNGKRINFHIKARNSSRQYSIPPSISAGVFIIKRK
jgi:hypothetical protein